jgi:UDP-N-acetylmuramoyl-tripeptide--D-alanyl-D-alanine ligase
MGAYVKGEIKGLCKLVKPQYGILTKIGTAHLESFGSEQNIIDGKFELIESLPSDGIGVLNGDDEKQVNYDLKNNCKIVWIGIDNEDVDVRALNIKCSNKGTHFDIMFKGDKKLYPFETRLLGNHNVYNILAAVALGKEFGIDIPDLQAAVRGVKPVEHRLEIKKLGSFYMIDDAYNSNPVGAKSAVDVLNMMPGVKVVVTPGMIELGDKEEELNKEFGKQIAEVADYVVLVGEKQTKPIMEGLKEKKYNEDNILVINDVRKAYDFITGLANTKEVYALFENDLPDTYNEK